MEKVHFPNWVRVLTTTAALVTDGLSGWRPDSSLLNCVMQNKLSKQHWLVSVAWLSLAEFKHMSRYLPHIFELSVIKCNSLAETTLKYPACGHC